MNLTDTEIQDNLKECSAILAAFKGERERANAIEGFLGELFTPAERADIATRWALIKALNQKLPQRKIAKNLGISLCRITRGSKELKSPDSTLVKMLLSYRKVSRCKISGFATGSVDNG
ncbi:MAG: hypothetical protein Ta2G_09670 [Termitinemataceae bacterium]|nr:MAG: hypothetical protein Ta2G_09670 [Termitinemataceae bacterium]